MTVDPHVFADADDLGRAVARLVLDRYQAADGLFVLGCPGGRSAASSYRALAAEVADRGAELSRLVIAMMDDYLVPDGRGGWQRERPDAAHSCERFARQEIVAPLDAAAGPGRGIAADHLLLPDPAEPEAYDALLADLGGVDLFLLASGSSDGHVAFNPPGAAADSTTRIVLLPDTTRQDNLGTFPSFGGDLDAVPTAGISVGVGTIREQSAEVVMIAHGPGKRTAVEHLRAAEDYDPAWPATIFAVCRNPHLFVDRAAVEHVSNDTEGN